MRGMWWPVIGGYHVGARGSFIFNNVVYFLL